MNTRQLRRSFFVVFLLVVALNGFALCATWCAIDRYTARVIIYVRKMLVVVWCATAIAVATSLSLGASGVGSWVTTVCS